VKYTVNVIFLQTSALLTTHLVKVADQKETSADAMAEEITEAAATEGTTTNAVAVVLVKAEEIIEAVAKTEVHANS
jgi:hypothetical protein